MQIVKIVLADDHQLFIAGLKGLLQYQDEDVIFQVVGVANDGDQAIELLRRHNPDVLILDLNMPDRDGLDILGTVREQFPKLRILTLTMYDDTKIVKSAFKAGVDGYALKTIGRDELINAINEVLTGRTYFGEGVRLNDPLEMIQKKLPKKADPYEDRFIKKYNLTKREIEILRLITLALSNKEIAKELFISDQTVSVHRKNIMRKLGVSNTAGLIKVAYDNSLI
ncbi:MAG: DNA-binding NarL/FixJ family response regulator [Polaribacter sp.]|jgi:DNA-binding NarL/FixJ family response regulator